MNRLWRRWRRADEIGPAGRCRLRPANKLKKQAQNSWEAGWPVNTLMPEWAETSPLQTPEYRVLTTKNGTDTAMAVVAAARMTRREDKGFKRCQKGILRIFSEEDRVNFSGPSAIGIWCFFIFS